MPQIKPELNHSYRTRSGRVVSIVNTDNGGIRQVTGVVQPFEQIHYTRDGFAEAITKAGQIQPESPDDLVSEIVPSPTTTVE